jgi:hypothetical protein
MHRFATSVTFSDEAIRGSKLPADSQPYFPIAELMSAVRGSNRSHVLNVEYEGWIPDIDPHIDCVRETARCVTLIKRYLNQP